jgi:hypothetical protein
MFKLHHKCRIRFRVESCRSRQEKVELSYVIHEIHFFAKNSGTRQLELLGDLDRDLRLVRSTIPSQKLAPVEVDIHQSKLVLKPRTIIGDKSDHSNIEQAATSLLESGQRIISELSKTNCDGRLVASVQELQKQLETRQNVIQLGLMNISCDTVCKKLDDELPNAVSALIVAHCRGVDLLLSQYPEWVRFLENAHASQLTDADTELVREAGHVLVQAMQNRPQLVDPEVPTTLLRILELALHPGTSMKRFTFAIIRSVENIVSKIYLYGIELIDATVKATIDKTSKNIARLAVYGLLVMAVQGSHALAPVAEKISELGWLKKATEAIEQVIEDVSK